MTYSSLNQLLYPHPDTRVKSNSKLRDGVETLWSNLDQQAEMKKGIIICTVRRTCASTLYAAVVLRSRTALCSIVSSKSISLNTCIPKNSKACSYTFVMRARYPVNIQNIDSQLCVLQKSPQINMFMFNLWWAHCGKVSFYLYFFFSK